MTRKSSRPSSQDAEDGAAKPSRRRTSSDTRRQTSEAAKARHKRALAKKFTPEERARAAEAHPPVERKAFEDVIRRLVTPVT